jgi:hypothetical protein
MRLERGHLVSTERRVCSVCSSWRVGRGCNVARTRGLEITYSIRPPPRAPCLNFACCTQFFGKRFADRENEVGLVLGQKHWFTGYRRRMKMTAMLGRRSGTPGAAASCSQLMSTDAVNLTDPTGSGRRGGRCLNHAGPRSAV